jgi:hypothetical protein
MRWRERSRAADRELRDRRGIAGLFPERRLAANPVGVTYDPELNCLPFRDEPRPFLGIRVSR